MTFWFSANGGLDDIFHPGPDIAISNGLGKIRADVRVIELLMRSRHIVFQGVDDLAVIPVVIDDATSADNQDAAVGSPRTTGMIARELGVEIHCVLFLIRTRKIPPASRAGHYRMFDDAAVRRVSAELRKAATETQR
jgi:hypothetical protein